MQVEKAVVTHAGIAPATYRLIDDRSTFELVCKLFLLGHEWYPGTLPLELQTQGVHRGFSFYTTNVIQVLHNVKGILQKISYSNAQLTKHGL